MTLLTKITAGGLGLLLLAAGWYFLAPRQLGGAASYAVISGISMEPKLHGGDLAILRERSAYHVGDVVAYRNADLGRTVLHRIVRQHGDRYVFKGDNNSFLDPGQARQADLVGELWLRVPGLGRVLRTVRAPWIAGLMIAVAAFLALGGLGAKTKRRPRLRRREAVAVAPAPAVEAPAEPADDLRGATTMLVGLLAAAGFFALLALVGFARPAARPVLDHTVYSQSGTFGYSGSAAASVAYQDGKLRSGDPIFFRLLHDVAFRFDYRLEAASAHGVAGTAALDAVLADGRGWRHTIALQPERPFSGSDVALRGDLDLDRVRELVQLFQTQTGINGDTFTLRIVPRVDVRGVVGNDPVSASFAPPLLFHVDANAMQLDSHSLDRHGASALPRTVSNHVFGLEVRSVRLVGVLGALAALAGALLAGLRLARGRRRDEAAWIAARYGSLIVSGSARHRLWDETVVTVGSFDDLARVARSQERPILHERLEGGHVYTLEDAGVLYRYELGGRRGATPLRAVA